jgi:hypothetical protein
MDKKEKEVSGRGFFDNIFQDILEFSAKPETHSYIEHHVIKPLLSRIFHHLYPYLIGILLLWLLMFACLAIILLLLMRGSILDSIVIFRK